MCRQRALRSGPTHKREEIDNMRMTGMCGDHERRSCPFWMAPSRERERERERELMSGPFLPEIEDDLDGLPL